MRSAIRGVILSCFLVISFISSPAQTESDMSRALLNQIFMKLGWGAGNGIQSLTANAKLQVGDESREVMIEGRRDGAYLVRTPATGAYTKVTRQRGVIFDGKTRRELQPQEIATAQPWMFPFLTDFSKFSLSTYAVHFLQIDSSDGCRPVELTPPKDMPREQATGKLTFCFNEEELIPVKLSFDRMAADSPSAHVRVGWKISDFRNTSGPALLPYKIEEWIDGNKEFTLTISNIQINSAPDSDFAF